MVDSKKIVDSKKSDSKVKTSKSKASAPKSAGAKSEDTSVSTLSYNVVDGAGKQVGQIELNGKLFAAPAKKSVVQQMIRWQLAKRRSGTHKTLTKGMMKGGTRKPWRQKGTGQARSGTNTSPLWVGGGVAHGPQPRSYEFRLSKRSRGEALAAVLSEKVKKGKLFVLDSIEVGGKTKEFIKLTENLGLKGRKLLLLLPDGARDSAVWKSARNVKGILPMQLSGVNPYDLLNHEYLVTTKLVIASLEQRV